MAATFSDNFQRADGAPGNGWTVETGTVDINSNRLRFNTANSRIARPVPVSNQSDLLVNVTLDQASNFSGSATFRVFLRSSEASTVSYRFTLTPGVYNGANCQIDRYDTSTVKSIGNTAQFACAAGPIVVGFQVVGSALSFFCNGALITTIQDANLASGLWVSMAGSGANSFYLDLFEIYAGTQATMYVVPGTVLPGSIGNPLAVGGLGTAWTPGTPGSPVFTVSAGSITSQTVQTANLATLVYNAPNYATSVIITDPSTGNTAVLLVLSTNNPPDSGGGGVGGLMWLLQLMLASSEWTAAHLGFGFTNDFIALIMNELGILTDDAPTAGNVKALVSTLAGVVTDLDTETVSPPSLRYVLDNAAMDAASANNQITTMVGDPALTLADVIAAIGTGGGLTKGDLDAAVAAITGTPPMNLNYFYGVFLYYVDLLLADTGGIKTILGDNSGATVIARLSTIQAEVEGIPTVTPATQTDVTNLKTALEGTDSRTLTDVYNKAQDAKDAADFNHGLTSPIILAIGALGLAITGEFTAAEGVIDGVVTGATGVTNADIAAFRLDFDLWKMGLDETFTNLSDSLVTLKTELDAIKADVEIQHSGPPAYPGSPFVDAFSPVAITENMTISAAMDGFYYNLTTVPKETSHKYIGDYDAMKFLGYAAFMDDHGNLERFQSVTWNKGLMTPVSIVHPSGVVIHWQTGAVGTVTPYTIAAIP